jgi:hypothetical protein
MTSGVSVSVFQRFSVSVFHRLHFCFLLSQFLFFPNRSVPLQKQPGRSW